MKNIFALSVISAFSISLNAQIDFVKSYVGIGSPQPLPVIEDLYNVECKGMADLDNDGDADIVAAGMKVGGNAQRNWWLLENTGNFGFQIKPDSIHLSSILPPLFTDLDNDGDLDVLSFKDSWNVSASSYNVALMNQGGFNFTPVALPILDSIRIQSYKVMYANNDAYPDLLVAGEKTGNVDGYTALFLNDGNGNFTAQGSSLGTVLYAGMQIIDKNSDGFDDIVFVGAASTAGVKANYFLLNNQDGTFTTSSYSTSPMYGGRIFVDDFDSDGHPDFMVSTIFGLGTPKLFINNHPSAGFTANYSLLPGGQGYSEHFHLMLDTDNDGTQEILAYLTSGIGPDTVKVYVKGSGGAYSISSTAALGDLYEIGNYDTIDINGDGYTDVFDLESDLIYYNDSAQGFVTPQHFRAFSPDFFWDFETADVNGDGFDDFLLSGSSPHTSGVYLNQGGQYFDRMDIPFFNSRIIRSIHPVDIDGDNDIDFVGMGNGYHPYVLTNLGNGQYSEQYLNSDPCEAVFVVNYDNLHHPDLLLIQEDPNNNYQDEVRIYATDASGNLSPVAVTGLPVVDVLSTYAAGDQNGDGLDDVYIGYTTSNFHYGVYLNNGNGSFSIASSFSSSTYQTKESDTYLANMDNDPELEVVSGAFSGFTNDFGIFDYSPTGPVFTNDPDLAGGRNTSFDLRDLNSDGRLDGAVFSMDDDELYYFINLPNGNFTSATIDAGPFTFPKVRFIDFDNDGDEDIFFAGRHQGINGEWMGYFYENTGGCTLRTQYDSIQTCDEPYTWIDGVQYDSDTSGVWVESTDTNMCDMMFYLHFERVILSADVAYVDPVTLTAVDSGAQYQWLDCGNNFSPIQGATGRIFSPTVNGNYAVVVQQGDCIDTSACMLIEDIGIREEGVVSFSAYPNPAHDRVNIKYPVTSSFMEYRIYTTHGTAVLSGSLDGSGFREIEVGELASGMYLIELSGPKGRSTETLIIVPR